MKEYLVKKNGVYVATSLASSDCIEIPEGATMLLYCESNNGFYHFANEENKLMATYAMKNGNASWYGDAKSYIEFGAEVVWRREQEIKMKEYIAQVNGKWRIVEDNEVASGRIEVPDGAEFLTCLDNNEEEVLIFWKEGGKKCLCCDDKWVSGQPPMSNYMDGYDAKIVWRREKAVEYLDPSDWSLKVVGENSKISGDWILVPEGADTLAGNINSDSCRYFWNHTDNLMIGCGESLSIYPDWENANGVTAFSWVGDKDVRGVGILWTRHTQPEELPFIDGEPKYEALDQFILENSENVAIPESWLKDESKPHNHYFKDVSELDEIDVYQVLRLFSVTDPCLQHIVKKALCAGQRGHKDFETDLKNIFDTAKRALEINNVSHNQGN